MILTDPLLLPGRHRISSQVERYNPLTNQWETRRSLATPRFFSHLQPAGSRLFLFGGATIDPNGNVACIRQVDCYHPSSDTWSSVNTLNEPRAEAGGAILGGKLYIIGGYSWDKELRLASAECYDIELNTWQEVKEIPAPLTGIACCPLTIYHTPQPDTKPHYHQPEMLPSDPTTEGLAAGEARSAIDSADTILLPRDTILLPPFECKSECLPRHVQSIP